MRKIYKIEVPECSCLTYEVGYRNVVSISEKDKIVSSCAETESASSKLYYEVLFGDDTVVELYADIKGLVVYRR